MRADRSTLPSPAKRRGRIIGSPAQAGDRGAALAQVDFEFGHSPAKQAGELAITKAREAEGPAGDLVGFLAGSWTGTRTALSCVWNS